MKSEFTLAFNQICSEYRLSREVVLDAIRAALVTAYRRDWNAPSTMNLSADINLDTGVARIFVTKQVVEEVEDPTQQISLEEARRTHPRARLGEMITLEVTPENFGRIAAQTAKQVITQRLREAERESQHARLTRQIGEIIIGTVQSVTAQSVVLHLDRNEEAVLPRSEQIPGERYMIHSKIRVYVLDVKRAAGRGPEIIVSRSHPNMLKRLLELEVPEIRNGSVEIRGVVREAGGRAKVAVASRQPGLDPVGACIGPRGVRIQSLTRELNGERIDVIEWSEDPARFVVNALSVPQVFSIVLDEKHPGGRTAALVVLDEHLSLAIGKNGQNARLTAKLTGWRVDIQGLKEALEWALRQVTADPNLLGSKSLALTERVQEIVREHEQNPYPYTDEEKHILKTFIESVRVAWNRREHGETAASAVAQPRAREEAKGATEQKARDKFRARVPANTYRLSVETLSVSSKTRAHLLRHGLLTVGDVLERLAQGDEAMLMLDGFGARVLAEVKDALAAGGFALLAEGASQPEEEVPVQPVVALEEAVAPAPASLEASAVPEPEPVSAVEPAPVLEEVGAAAQPAEEPVEEVTDLAALFDKRRFEVPAEMDEEEPEEEIPTRGKKPHAKGKAKRKARPIFYDDEEDKYLVRRPGKKDWDDDLLD